jgi:hypothetical protein
MVFNRINTERIPPELAELRAMLTRDREKIRMLWINEKTFFSLIDRARKACLLWLRDAEVERKQFNLICLALDELADCTENCLLRFRGKVWLREKETLASLEKLESEFVALQTLIRERPIISTTTPEGILAKAKADAACLLEDAAYRADRIQAYADAMRQSGRKYRPPMDELKAICIRKSVLGNRIWIEELAFYTATCYLVLESVSLLGESLKNDKTGQSFITELDALTQLIEGGTYVVFKMVVDRKELEFGRTVNSHLI